MDKTKIIDAAAKLVAKGAYDKAIKEYQRVLSADPKDVRVLQKLGELYQKKNDPEQAAQFFIKVAETYSSEGFFLKAVALYKQVLKLSPNLVDVNLRLAELHEQLQLMSEAAAYYQLVANHHEQAGDIKASLDTLKKLLDVSPENVTSRVKLGELYSREKMVSEALQEFARAAEYLKRYNRPEDYMRVLERAAFLDPGNVKLAQELAEAYFAAGDFKRSIVRLQVCFKADPRDTKMLSLLAKAFEGDSQTTKAVSVYKELAKIYAEQRNSEADAMWAKIEQLDASDSDALERRRASEPFGLTPGDEETLSPPLAPAPPPAAPPVTPPPSARAQDPVARVLTETDVYLKYNLHDRALEHLGKIFSQDPENLDAHEKAYQIYVAANNRQLALDQLVNVLRLCTRSGNVSRGVKYLRILEEESPDHPELEVFTSVLGDESASDQGSEALEEQGAEDIVIEMDEEIIATDELAQESSTAAERDLALESVVGLETDELTTEESEPRHEPMAEGSPPVEDEPLMQAEAPPPPKEEEVVFDAVDSEEPVYVSPEPIEAEAHFPSLMESAEVPAAEEDPVAEEIAEAGFFVDQGLYDEARESLDTILIAYPGHPGALALLEKLDQLPKEELLDFPAEASPSGVAAPSSDEFQYPVEEVLAEFKRGLQKVVQPSDVDTHYDLGIAYKEMGLFDDAIAEFTVARQGCLRQTKEIDCLTMIGMMRQMKGDLAGAIDCFKQALTNEHVTVERRKALQYDLATAWELAGNLGKALYHYQRVAKLDPRYRDISGIVARLSASTKPEEDSLPGKQPGEVSVRP